MRPKAATGIQQGTAWYAVAAAVAVTLSVLDSACVTRGDEPTEGEKAASEKEKSETRMKFMMQALEKYEADYSDDSSRSSRLYQKPLLRWSNPLTTIRDGALVVYTRGGRPDLVCEFHIHTESRFGHEFSPIRLKA